VQTAAECLTHPDFLAFCNRWQEDGRCPLPFADWLREHGLDGQADAAAWAAVEPDRHTHYRRTKNDVRGGIYPYFTSNVWAWGVDDVRKEDKGRCNLPRNIWNQIPVVKKPDDVQFHGGPTFALAVAAFLDAWAVVRGPASVEVAT
jgi:hypothetical protein